ncbi:MAG: sigma-54-dependent Fis family transcriptional regulator, partial [Nitrospirae bacterium]|nr:sigma-54-dependent Fis family transcriptional regulator [Nitrospirota bacterium]
GKYNRLLGRTVREVSPEALEKLLAHPWMGNVRELENVIERAIALGSADVLVAEDVKDSLDQGIHPRSPLILNIPPEGLDIDATLGEIEKRLLLKALERSRGVKKEAANLLKIDFRSFRYRLSKYGIGGREDREEDET